MKKRVLRIQKDLNFDWDGILLYLKNQYEQKMTEAAVIQATIAAVKKAAQDDVVPADYSYLFTKKNEQ